MKFLIIGLGSMGKRRIKNLLQLQIKPEQIVGFDPKRDRADGASKLFSIKTLNDYKEAMTLNPDALIICSPPDQHLEYAFSAIENNKHFFTELTWPSNMEDYYKMIDLLKKKKNIIGVPSYSLRNYPHIKKIKELIDHNEIGKVVSIIYYSGQWLGDWHPWEKVADYFVSRKDTGGCRELMLFELNWITWVMGDIKSVSAVGKKMTNLPIEAKDIWSMLVEFENGAIGSLTFDTIQRDPNRFCKIISEDGLIIWDWKTRSLKMYKAKDKTWQEFPESHGYAGYSIEQMYLEGTKNFVEAIKGKIKYGITFDDEEKVIRTIKAINKSNETKVKEILSKAGKAVFSTIPLLVSFKDNLIDLILN